MNKKNLVYRDVMQDEHDDLRLWLRLLSSTHRIENRLRSRFRQEFDSTLPRFDLMAQLERNPEGLRMTALSELLMVSCGNVTGVTDQLERDGSVVRILDPADRRVIIVSLTPAGLRKFRLMAKAHEQWIIELLAGVTDEDKRRLFPLLQRLKESLAPRTVTELGASGLAVAGR